MNLAIIGANYGDEGKGLATNYFTRNSNSIVIRHNGGAQSGHTVELNDGRRFVFHELSSGSFNNAITYWADSFYPDLFKLHDEILDFYNISNIIPKIYASENANITLVFDVMLNQKREQERGNKKHGSCGMGIWEAVQRIRAGYGITIKEVYEDDKDVLLNKIKNIIDNYYLTQDANLDYDINLLYYIELLKSTEKFVTLVKDEVEFFKNNQFDNIIFETGQGLLLNGDRKDLIPYNTPSCTSLNNPLRLADQYGIKLDNVVYVTRTYLTRHGAGPFIEDPDIKFEDKTNIPNPWQDSIRFGRINIDELNNRVIEDSQNVPSILFITHIDETNNKMLTTNGDIDISDIKIKTNKVYLCEDKFADNVHERDLEYAIIT